MQYRIIEPSPTSKILIHEVNYKDLELLKQEVLSYGFNISNIEQIKNNNRKAEWLSVRKLLNTQFTSPIDIVYNDQNKPFIKNSDMSLSISHSHHRIGVYLKDSEPIGIDLQRVTKKIRRIKHKYLSAVEIKQLNHLNSDDLTIYWSLKEATFKAYGINDIFLKENIQIIELDSSSSEALCRVQKDAFNQIFKLKFELQDDYALAYVVNS